MDIKKGDILFVYGGGIVDHLIEDISHGPCHTAVIVDKQRVVEAQGFRDVGYNNLSNYSDNIKIYRIPNSQENINAGIQWLYEQFGRGYDYWDIVVLFFRCIFQWKLSWKEGKRLICSRLVRDYIAKCNLNIPDTNMTPKDAEDWVIANGAELIVDKVSKSK